MYIIHMNYANHFFIKCGCYKITVNHSAVWLSLWQQIAL